MKHQTLGLTKHNLLIFFNKWWVFRSLWLSRQHLFMQTKRVLTIWTLLLSKTDPIPSFFSQQSRSRIQDLSFLAFTHSFRGPQKQESRNNHNSSIFGAKNKARDNILWEKLMDIFLVQWSFEKHIFFFLLIKQVSLIMLNSCKRFEFMVYPRFL